MIKKATKFIFLGLFLYAFVGTNAVVGQEQSDIFLSGEFNGWGEDLPMFKFGNGYLYVITQLNTNDDQQFKFRTDEWENDWGRDEDYTLNFKEKIDVWGNNPNWGGPENMIITPTSGNYYTFTMEKPSDYEGDTFIMVQETSAKPATIDEVTQTPAIGSVGLGDDVTVTVTLSDTPSPEEIFYIRYAVDGDWDNTNQLKLDFSEGNTTSAIIPSYDFDEVNYYVFSTTINDIEADFDLATINMNNNEGNNYVYSAANWETIADGGWDDANTWNLGLVPPTGISMGNVTINHEVTSNQDAIINELNIGEDGAVEFNDDTEVIISGGNFADNTAEFYDLIIKGDVHFGENATINNSLTIEGGYLRISEDGTGISDEKYIPDYKEGATLIYAGDFGYGDENFAGAFGESDEKRPTNIVIKEGKTVSLNEPLRKVSGTLTVEENATLNTGNQLYLLAGSNLVNQGEINDRARFQQKIEGNEGWRMLSSPTTNYGEEGGSLTYNSLLHDNFWIQGMFEGDQGGHTSFGEPNIRYFDTETNDFVGIQKAYDDLVPGQGFIFYVYNIEPSDWLGEESETPESAEGTFVKYIEIEGEVVNSDVNISLNKNPDGVTLLGNPYAFAIDWDDVKTGSNDITESIYVYDRAYNNVSSPDFEDPIVGGGYRTWNGNVGSFSGEIAPFQGFWVINKPEVSEEPELTFEPKLIDDADDAVFYKQSSEKVSFTLSAKMDNYMDYAYFSFNDKGSEDIDNFDAYKLSPLDYVNYMSFSSLVNDAALDINNLPINLKGEPEFPLQINVFEAADGNYALKSGEVTIRLDDLKNIPEQWGITLNNYNTGETVDLRAASEYTFYLNPKQKVAPAQAATSILADITPSKEKTGLNETGISITISADDTPTNKEIEEKPTIFALEQNYPNPFNPTTTIKYSVAEAGQVNLTVYNVMGQKVAELVNTNKSAGAYSITWDAKNAASGMYFYKLTSATQSITKQMMLIK